ncbi:hypothetical protein [Clostridium sp. CCUG 7971]|uniref:hypothetical protein n=1 Tax=Clostridium sp. CCUG 7971 TaxID=2811414 RepID=UPI001ABBB2E2|nr:hypothetical protein [Clostridium sp. CCUG 7971]MBO3445292.1 hypothetical protein [Clostridium sp. CCUG 7971]
MKVLQRGLKKEDIVKIKRYNKWHIVTDNDVRMLVNETSNTDNDDNSNKVDWKNNKAYIFMDSFESSKKFYEKNKELELKLYIKADIGTLYNEYKVNDWSLTERGIEVDLA